MANKPLKSIKWPDLPDTYTVPVIDNTLSIQGKAADAKKVGDELSDIKSDLASLGGGVPTTVRQAMLALFEAGAYAQTGLTDEIAVVESWASAVTAISLNKSSTTITGTGTEQLTATTTPAGGTVTWQSSDTSVCTVSSSGLVTGVGNGSATITASCGDLSATCSVTVSGFATLTSISAVYTQSGTVYDTDSLDDLKTDLVVTAYYSDTTTATITTYALSGSLTVGTSTITVSYGGKTTTFTVTVTAAPNIPVEYQEVEWVEFDGNSRIVTTASGDIKHSYDVKAFVDDDTEQFIVGLCSSSAAEVEIGKAANENRLFLYASSSLSISNITDLTSYPAVITAHFEKSVSRDITAIVNGNEYTNTASNPTKNVTSSHKFVLGSAGTGSQRYGYTGKIYYAKYYANDVLACDLVPCYRIADTVIGFYDKVSKTFYTNSGTGTLTKGSDVS